MSKFGGQVRFTSTSIRSICSSVNVSIASINYHFKNKKCLITEVVHYAFAEFEKVISESKIEASSDLHKFLILYAKKTYQLDKEVLLLFRDIFQHEEQSLDLNKNITKIKSQFNLTAQSIANQDEN